MGQYDMQALITQAIRTYNISRNEAEETLKSCKYEWNDFVRIMDAKLGRSASPYVVADQDELSIALEMSKREEDERLLSITIEQSKMVPQPMAISTDLVSNDDDIVMQHAIAVSIETNQNKNPRENKRETGVPVGLRNVGNTCYVNSLLQTYFMLSPLRKFVFEIVADEKETDEPKVKYLKKFLRELQLLFGRMIQSNEKSVDPSNVLNAIVDENGKPSLSIGLQQDLGEFMGIFVDWMERALKLYSNPSKENYDFMKEMFEIRAVEFITATEQSGEPVECINGCVYTFMMLDVKYKDFYCALDEALEANADWTTPKQYATKAEKRTWLTRIPPVIMFQESRGRYDRAENKATKNRTPMTFKKDIDLARYLRENQNITTEKRILVSQYRQKLEAVEKQIQELNACPLVGVPYEKLFQAVLEVLKETDPDAHNTVPIDEDLQNKLRARVEFYKKKAHDMNDQATKLRDLISNAYADVEGCKYTLYAVWIHSGPTPGSGHYWAYIRNFPNDTWIKYNDTVVNTVSVDEVWRHAVGGDTSDISAYFLIYINSDTANELTTTILSAEQVPISVLAQVERENQQFQQSILDYERESEKKELSRAEKFVYRYHEIKEKIEDEKTIYDYDPRLSCYGLWLKSLGLEYKVVIGLVLASLWLEIFNSQIQQEYYSDSADLRSVRQLLLNPSITKIPVSASQEDLENEASNLLKLSDHALGEPHMNADYRFFRDFYNYLGEAFKEFNLQMYSQGLKLLFGAYSRWKFQNKWKPTVPDVKALMRIFIESLVNKSLQDIKNKAPQTPVGLKEAIFVIQEVFVEEWDSNWITNLRAKCMDTVMTNESQQLPDHMVNYLIETMQYWTDSSEAVIGVNFDCGKVIEPAEDWNTFAQEIMKDYTKFRVSIDFHVFQEANPGLISTLPERYQFRFPNFTMQPASNQFREYPPDKEVNTTDQNMDVDTDT